MTMTILEKLKLSEKTRSEMLTSPKLKMRAKIVEAIEYQIAAAEADAKDEAGKLMCDNTRRSSLSNRAG